MTVTWAHVEEALERAKAELGEPGDVVGILERTRDLLPEVVASRAVAAEREACAQTVVDSGWHNDECPSSHGHPGYACECELRKIAAAIRARGKP
jgi:hypothetical protein